MFDPLLTGVILGGIEQASQNAIRRQNAQAGQYGNGSARLDSIQSQQDIQKRIQQMHLKTSANDHSGFESLTMINDLTAKFAVCCYVSYADGFLSERERNKLMLLLNDVCNICKTDQVRNELLHIMDNSGMDFVFLEKYLNDATPQSISSALSLAEEISNVTTNTSSEENRRIYRIRKYLTDRTGVNFITNTIQTNKDVDPRCSGCAAIMEFVPYLHRLECPYCGNVKYI